MPRAWVREGRREKMETIGKGIIDGTAFFNWEGEREEHQQRDKEGARKVASCFTLVWRSVL